MKKILLSLLILLPLCGCVDIEVATHVERDGSGVQKWKFTTTALLGGEIRKKIENNPFFDPKKAKIFDEYKEGDYILQAEVPFKRADELKDRDRSVAFESAGWFRRTYSYTETWKRTSGSTGLLAEHAGSMIPVTMQVSVEMPGRIVDSNADVVQGSVARWSIPVSDLLGAKKLEVRSQSWNYWLIIPLTLGLLFAAGGVAMLAADRSKKMATSGTLINCPACKSVIAAGAAFCSSCGAKLSGT